MKTLKEQIANVETLLAEKKLINRPNAKTRREIDALEKNLIALKDQLSTQLDEIPNEIIINSDAPVSNEKLLEQLSALNITDKLKKSSDNRSVFKKEFSNKSDRTKCRTKFLNAISLYLLNVAHNKKELAEKELSKAKEIASMYYVAEDNFKNYSDYCTENMEQQKKDTIKLFIETINS